MWPDFYYGVCYYPEHWDPKRHASDIARIADCGVNFVRLGEGAWSYWEPEEGRFQFDMFDQVINLCRKHEVKVIMGTPTYCAPAWVASKYPEVLRWNFDRTPMAHGSRRNFNYTSPKYFELSDRIVTAMAEHYADEEQIIGWQLDNEFNCHMDVSYAPSDTIAFRQWLKEKYRTLDRLNEAWGTRFWSQTYSDWNQIDLPHPTATYLNPHLLLDEKRFISDCVVRFAQRQANILRAHNADWQITHNGLFGNINGPDLVGVLDFFSHDQYPLFYGENAWWQYNYNLIQARSLSQPYAILEQQSGPGGQMSYLQRTPRPGEMRLWAWQSIAHGAKMFSYFRWRTCPYGSEQHWHGLLDQDDRDNRRIAEAKLVGEELRALPKSFHDAPVVRTAAVMRDFDNEANDWRINTYTNSGQHEIGRWCAELSRHHVPVDQVWSGSDDLDGYSLLVAPHLKITDKGLVAKLTRFVEAGGTLVLGAQSGLKDRNNHIVEQTPPGPLRKLAGIEVEDWTTLSENESRDASLNGGPRVAMITFVERLRARGAEVLGRWTTPDPLLADAPAITRNAVSKGQVYYIGGYLPAGSIATIIRELMRDLEVRPLIRAGTEVEVVARRGAKQTYYTLLNHSPSKQRVTGLSGKDLMSGERVPSDGVVLAPYGVAIVESPAAPRRT